MSKVYIEGIGSQPADIQQELTSKVQALGSKDIGKDGLVRIVVKGLIYIGRLILAGRVRSFKVERCEKVKPSAESASEDSATDASASAPSAPAKRAPRKSAPKKSATATKRAKRSSK